MHLTCDIKMDLACRPITQQRPNYPERLSTMSQEWVSPEFEAIELNCEINCYASAEIE